MISTADGSLKDTPKVVLVATYRRPKISQRAVAEMYARYGSVQKPSLPRVLAWYLRSMEWYVRGAVVYWGVLLLLFPVVLIGLVVGGIPYLLLWQHVARWSVLVSLSIPGLWFLVGLALPARYAANTITRRGALIGISVMSTLGLVAWIIGGERSNPPQLYERLLILAGGSSVAVWGWVFGQYERPAMRWMPRWMHWCVAVGRVVWVILVVGWLTLPAFAPFVPHIVEQGMHGAVWIVIGFQWVYKRWVETHREAR